MYRTNPRKQMSLFDRAQVLEGSHRAWVFQGLATIALLAPAGRSKNAEALHKLLWVILQMMFFGEPEVSSYVLEEYSVLNFTEEDYLKQAAEVDSILIDALKEFGLAELVLARLDEVQLGEDPLIDDESWPRIRSWFEKVLA